MNKKFQDSFIPLLELFLPEFILEHFDLKNVRKEGDIYHLELEEMNTPPQQFASDSLLSKGFFPSITVQDFPIRGRKVFMHIKRRRWLNQQTGKVVYRGWTEVATGTRVTSEFAAFLKEISRYVEHGH